MIKFLDILKESDDNIFIPRGSKEEKDKVLLRRTNDKIQEYIKNGSEGNLDLRNSPIKFLPKNLTKVGGYLWLDFCENLQSLPNGLEVGGDLVLMYSQIEKLPDNLTVNGRLDLESCKNLQSLPNGLKVERSMDLRNTNITSLPSDLEVGGDLILLRTPISRSYTEKQIRKMVSKVEGSIYLRQ